MLRIGLNPYGLTYTLGLQGIGTPRANPTPGGMPAFLALAEELNVRAIELDLDMLRALEKDEVAALRDRLRAREMTPVISASLADAEIALGWAAQLGVSVIRVGLTPVLCGDRAELGVGWFEMTANVRQSLSRLGPMAAARDLTLAIEDHQDFTSAELIEFCETCGPGIGICLDTANPLSVGEEPVAFASAVAPYLRHVHLKDYWVQWTDEGYRLIRCPVGDGVIPFHVILPILTAHQPELTASIEIGALHARHIRLLTAKWWHGYAERPARDLAVALSAARIGRLPESAEWRTPWELGADRQTLIDYEIGQVRKSAANLRAMGWM
ncbi:MAG: sugar phosphate isomerase/epimerase [Anaerolineae bacterium]|nr:sugar phosphate isomerase/epimerase [Thermoflexales bacterium]MDW8407095.1 sugar phosphate isomerase/epimerase [Anaerolineae bacterium]